MSRFSPAGDSSACAPRPAIEQTSTPSVGVLLRAEIDLVLAQVSGTDPTAARESLTAARAEHAATPLDEVSEGFGLSPFERAVLLLACAPDLAGAAREALLAATGSPRASFATALAHLDAPHWDAVAPHGPLRYWALVEPADLADPIASPLVPDESVLHHLVGVTSPGERLTRMSHTLELPTVLPPGLRECAVTVGSRLRSQTPVVLTGPQPGNVQVVATAAATIAGLTPRGLRLADLPPTAEEQSLLLRLMTRETVLSRWAWVIDAAGAPADRLAGLLAAGPDTDAPILVLATGTPDVADTARVGVPRLTPAERHLTWHAALEGVDVTRPDADLAAVSAAFDLAVPDMCSVAREVAEGASLWSAAKARVGVRVDGLAAVRPARAHWSDLVLPDGTLRALRALVSAVRHRTTVLEDWGFGRRGRGLGTTALFAGPSGTGKTLAAEVIAHDLDYDLVHVDLSQVVSKYIGETEKHLAALFDAAEGGGTVLLFDEADALFGKRSEVRDAHDRYANIEVGYLLQRLEAFTGLAILTTNARSALDRAFTRRLATVVSFPYPDAEARRRLWQANLPTAMPRGELDVDRLAQADLSGGDIAAAALTAAYLAAGDDRPVDMTHLADAVRWELAKSGRTAPRDRAR